MEIIGREYETGVLNNMYLSDKSQFVAVYGRRRVGKTYLVRHFFGNRFAFEHTGLANASLRDQLKNFEFSLRNAGLKKFPKIFNWLDAFQYIKNLMLSRPENEKKVIFIDELPWLDTPRSGFVTALEHFWNGWAAHRNDILFIVCGSSTSWMLNKLINNKGGLHNRISCRIKISPFTIVECRKYLHSRKIYWTDYDTAEAYMALGGIPYYWSLLQNGLSVSQNIEILFFQNNGGLRNEFPNLYAALFTSSEKYVKIIEALSKKRIGLVRNELIKAIGESSGGGLTSMLNDLENCDFIRSYVPLGQKLRDRIYQLTDFYSSFYFHFLEDKSNFSDNYWISLTDSTIHRAWAGFSFEMLCLLHAPQLKKALGISGIRTNEYAWRSKNAADGVQIDLLIDRNDHVINLCEMKFSLNKFNIDKAYAESLRRKIGVFKDETKTTKSIFLTMITSFGLKPNEYANMVQNALSLDALFEL